MQESFRARGSCSAALRVPRGSGHVSEIRMRGILRHSYIQLCTPSVYPGHSVRKFIIRQLALDRRLEAKVPDSGILPFSDR